MKLFLPHKTLEDWATTDKADLSDGRLIVKETKSSHQVTPAVHFQKLVSGDDLQSLLGRVKTQTQLQAMGAEQLGDSCLIGETAYEVVEGFVAEVILAPGAAKPADTKKKSSSPEADLLAAFILDKL